MRLRLNVREEVAVLLIPNLYDLLVSGYELARGGVVLDCLDWLSIVVSQGIDGHRVAHIIGKHFAFFCSYRHLQSLSRLESHRRDLLADHTLR